MAHDNWQQHKATIILMYAIDRKPLSEVIDYMRKEHNFDQKKHQYEYQLKKWKVKKNIPKEHWQYISHCIRKRKKKEKKSEVFVHGIPIPEDRIRREMQRYTTIPIHSQFGKRLPSPASPGDEIVRVRSPSVAELISLWPDNLPWFEFSSRVITKLHLSSDPLNAFLRVLGSHSDPQKLPEKPNPLSLYAVATDLSNLRKIFLHHSNYVPKRPQEGSEQIDFLTSSRDSQLIAAEMLKIIFFRLSNKLDCAESHDQQQLHDQLMLHLWKEISRSNPQLFSDLFASSCATTDAIKEAMYGCAIRQRELTMVSRLLDSGIDSNIPVRYFHSIDLRFERGMIRTEFIYRSYMLSGIEIAAFDCDMNLAEIILQSRADINCLANVSGALLMFVALKEKRRIIAASEMVRLAQLLIKRGATVNPLASRCGCGTRVQRSPLGLSIANHYNQLAEFLIREGADITVKSSHCSRVDCEGSWYGAYLELRQTGWTPLEIAMISGNEKMTERLLTLTLSSTVQASQIRELLVTSCLVGDTNVMSRLLNLGIQLAGSWNHGITPLVATAWNPITEAYQDLLGLCSAQISLSQDENGIVARTQRPLPIHVAASHGNAALLRHLIGLGVECNILYQPVKAEEKWGDHEMGWLLPQLTSGFPAYSHKFFEWSPLQLALDNGDHESIALLLLRTDIYGGEIRQAILNGDNNIVSAIVARGADILHVDGLGGTALEAAVERGNEYIIRLYFESGGQYRSSALYVAAEAANISKNYDVLSLLVHRRPSGAVDSHEASALVLSIVHGNFDLFNRLLLSFDPGPARSFCWETSLVLSIKYIPRYYGMNRDFPDNGVEGLTPLAAAVISGNIAMLQEMTKHGYALQRFDISALMRPTRDKDNIHTAIRNWLRTQVYPRHGQTSWNQRAFVYSILDGDTDNIMRCIDSLESLNFLFPRAPAPSSHVSPLGLAVEEGDNATIEMLLAAGASLDYKWADHMDYMTPLQVAASNENASMVRLLVDRGADVNAPPCWERGATALQYAAIKGNMSIAKFLLDKGANLNAAPAKYHGRTCLEGAAENGRLDMVKLLLEQGVKCDREARIYYIRSVGFARRNGHSTIAKILRDHGSWSPEDQFLWDSPRYRDETAFFRYDEASDKWHTRWTVQEIRPYRYEAGWYDDDASWHSIGSSDDSRSIEEEYSPASDSHSENDDNGLESSGYEDTEQEPLICDRDVDDSDADASRHENFAAGPYENDLEDRFSFPNTNQEDNLSESTADPRKISEKPGELPTLKLHWQTSSHEAERSLTIRPFLATSTEDPFWGAGEVEESELWIS
ncbi:ankyrin repeat-containing domain protein [Xylariaceae sp. FL0255]|nr:ankyrin repeat-containing domain protein [Xylariaceae sp. FL0255]